ncbi:MAG: DUF3011 domain-containing protein [Methylocystis sp.]|uniref:DUF3011 domain-containing protein n=1 Tax=Methylocystis sp. TaxID=1911079 RepID=UPI003DA61071
MRLSAAIGLLTSLILLVPAATAGEFACNSLRGELNRCALKNADRLKVRLKLDREGGCKKNETWGVDADGVWVDMGCEAVFSFKHPSERSWWQKLFPRANR